MGNNCCGSSIASCIQKMSYIPQQYDNSRNNNPELVTDLSKHIPINITPNQNEEQHVQEQQLIETPSSVPNQIISVQTPMIPNKTINVMLQSSLYEETYQFSINNENNGFQLKEYIYQNVVQQLRVKMMSIFYQKEEIQNHKKLIQYGFEGGMNITLNQEKIELLKISISTLKDKDIKILPKQCMISYEHGVGRMLCGHNIGRDSMADLIKNTIQSYQYEIRCPHEKQNGNKCNQVWDFEICSFVAGLTATENQKYSDELSQNMMKKECKTCPNLKCQITVYKGNLREDRVSCKSCRFSFCYYCLNKWTSDNQYCNSKQCEEVGQIITNSPVTRQFIFNQDGVQTSAMTPKIRSCLFCKKALENYRNCKHTECTFCKHSFCWICLAVINYDGTWPCGKPNQYCGKTAPTQILSSRQRKQPEDQIKNKSKKQLQK